MNPGTLTSSVVIAVIVAVAAFFAFRRITAASRRLGVAQSAREAVMLGEIARAAGVGVTRTPGTVAEPVVAPPARSLDEMAAFLDATPEPTVQQNPPVSPQITGETLQAAVGVVVAALRQAADNAEAVACSQVGLESAKAELIVDSMRKMIRTLPLGGLLALEKPVSPASATLIRRVT